MRAVVYARYSSENQSEASIDDQVEVCRRLIARQDWTLTEVFHDKAMSGASRFRPAYQELLAAAEKRRFDVVVCEALDRLGRNLSDVAGLHDRLTFLGIKLHTVNVGEIAALHIGMLGTMAQLFLSDLREKTWRGLLGRARQGRIPGGRAYGYEVVGPGERRIVPAEAAIVRRVFEEYDVGLSPRAIARKLNLQEIPGPTGEQWRDTTIRGQGARGTGFLNNPIYIGRLVWNRTSYVKDPRTGKRSARINGDAKREVVEVPELRIIDDALWDRVKARQAEAKAASGNGKLQYTARRQRYLLSSLLFCGCCGAPYVVLGRDRFGCSGYRAKGTCTNGKSITRQAIEGRVLDGLRDRLMEPDLLDVFIASFKEEVEKVNREAAAARKTHAREAEKIERQLSGIRRAIEDGLYDPEMKGRMATLLARQAEIEAQTAVAPMPTIVPHPNLPEVYRRNVASLAEALNDPDAKPEATQILRSLVDRVVLTPDDEAPNRLRAELHGVLAAVLELGSAKTASALKHRHPEGASSGCQLSVVAGTRNRLNLLLEA